MVSLSPITSYTGVKGAAISLSWGSPSNRPEILKHFSLWTFYAHKQTLWSPTSIYREGVHHPYPPTPFLLCIGIQYKAQVHTRLGQSGIHTTCDIENPWLVFQCVVCSGRAYLTTSGWFLQSKPSSCFPPLQGSPSFLLEVRRQLEKGVLDYKNGLQGNG